MLRCNFSGECNQQAAVRSPIVDRRIVFCFPQLLLGLSGRRYRRTTCSCRNSNSVARSLTFPRLPSDCERQRSAADRNPLSGEQSPEQIDSNGKQLFLAIREKSPRPMKTKRPVPSGRIQRNVYAAVASTCPRLRSHAIRL